MAGKGFRGMGAAVLAMATGACASGAAPSHTGFLTTYEGLAPRTDVVRASVSQRRDEALASASPGYGWRPPRSSASRIQCFLMTTGAR